jgi:hypothetical protein
MTSSIAIDGVAPRRRRPAVYRIALVTFVVMGWIATSMLWPRRADFRAFDGGEVGRLDAAMWRSYYERKPARLFWQLARSLRAQFDIGFVRSFPTAYLAAKAAFVFKDGRSRADYAKALPELERYFASINAVAAEPFDANAAARNELEWWIIRREPGTHTTADWERLIAAVAAEIYHVPAERAAEYARLRVEAMVLRDQRGGSITEDDWRRINALLEQSWGSLAAAVRKRSAS